MKRIVLMALLAMALPMAMFASSSVDFTNSSGVLSGSTAGLTLSGSELIAVNGLRRAGLGYWRPGKRKLFHRRSDVRRNYCSADGRQLRWRRHFRYYW